MSEVELMRVCRQNVAVSSQRVLQEADKKRGHVELVDKEVSRRVRMIIFLSVLLGLLFFQYPSVWVTITKFLVGYQMVYSLLIIKMLNEHREVLLKQVEAMKQLYYSLKYA